MSATQATCRQPARVLVTDLDGTLIGDAEAMRSLLTWCKERQNVRLVYNTGRTFRSVRRLIADLSLPWPDALVTGVGTDIRYWPWDRPDAAWNRRIAARWERSAVEALASEIGPELRPQPPLAQGPFKVSYEVRDPDVAAAFFARLRRERLWVHGILTEDRWVDVIPFRAGKGAAAAYLRMRYGVGPWQMLASGDSENDLGMLSCNGPAVAVGNATRSLLRRLTPQVYRARLPAAAGILEGLRHFGWS